jgi:hypothetical protein
LLDDVVTVFLSDGTVGPARKPDGFIKATYVRPDGTSTGVFAHEDSTFRVYLGRVVDTDAGRERNGYYKLNQVFYPEDRGWYNAGIALLTDGTYIKSADAVRVYNPESKARTSIHKSQLDKSYIRLANHDSYPWYVAPEHASYVLRTVTTKAKVVDGLHAICETWQGWDYLRGRDRKVGIFGLFYRYTKKEASLPEFRAFVQRRRTEVLQEQWDSHTGSLALFWHGLELDVGYIYPHENNRYFKSQTYRASYEASVGFMEEYLRAVLDTYYAGEEAKFAARFLLREIAQMQAVNGEEPNHSVTAVINQELETA